jgi:hypothetical protein
MSKRKITELNQSVIWGIIFTIIFGLLLHFVYKWSGNNPIVGLLSPVNESVWEHLKLLYYPVSICFLIGYFKYGKSNSNYLFYAFIGLLSGLLLIPILFYLYTSIIGRDVLVIDIAIFVISVIISFLIFKFFYKNYNFCFLSNKAVIILWEITFILFVFFTIFPPDIPLFQEYQ